MKRARIAAPKDEALAETRKLAQRHASEAMEKLMLLVRGGKSEAVQVAAIKELLDRAHGRPAASPGEGGGLRHVLVDDGYRD